jgi:hypothetical protein
MLYFELLSDNSRTKYQIIYINIYIKNDLNVDIGIFYNITDCINLQNHKSIKNEIRNDNK